MLCGHLAVGFFVRHRSSLIWGISTKHNMFHKKASHLFLYVSSTCQKARWPYTLQFAWINLNCIVWGSLSAEMKFGIIQSVIGEGFQKLCHKCSNLLMVSGEYWQAVLTKEGPRCLQRLSRIKRTAYMGSILIIFLRKPSNHYGVYPE